MQEVLAPSAIVDLVVFKAVFMFLRQRVGFDYATQGVTGLAACPMPNGWQEIVWSWWWASAERQLVSTMS